MIKKLKDALTGKNRYLNIIESVSNDNLLNEIESELNFLEDELELEADFLNDLDDDLDDFLYVDYNNEEEDDDEGGDLSYEIPELPKYVQLVINTLKRQNYQSITESRIDNIFLFYKIFNNKLYITYIKDDSLYYKREFNKVNENNFNFSIEHQILDINELKSIYQYKNKLNIETFNNKIQFSFYKNYKEEFSEITQEETKKIAEEKELSLMNVQKLNLSILNYQQNKKINLIQI